MTQSTVSMCQDKHSRQLLQLGVWLRLLMLPAGDWVICARDTLLEWCQLRTCHALIRGTPMVRNDFKLEIDWIKALPPGQETDIVLVSCVGATLTGAEREKVAQAKRCAQGPPCHSPALALLSPSALSQCFAPHIAQSMEPSAGRDLAGCLLPLGSTSVCEVARAAWTRLLESFRRRHGGVAM
jgi:hypothetical protein